MRPTCCAALASLAVSLAMPSPGRGDDPPAKPSPVASERPDGEVEALAFVREHHPELASVVEALKPRNPNEYRKAIGELATVARSLAPLRERNPKRYTIALDAWKARSRVELLAARLGNDPGEEKLSELRLAIETKLDSDIAHQRFELEQAEAAALKARAALDRLEGHRDEIIEARLRALKPRKAAAKAKAQLKTAPAPAPAAATGSPDITKGGNRR